MPPRATPLVLHPPSARHASLPQVLPSVAASMGVPGFGPADNTLGLAPARSSVVVLIDGLGERLLRRRSGHAPFLRSLLAAGASLECGFPATTATSLASLGTGLTAGGHGLLGYQLRIPGSDRLFDHLSWEGGPDPLAWQPSSTIFERVVGADVDVVRIGLGRFDGSGLTTAALRGGRYVAAASLAQGVRAALAALRRSPSVLVYLYWGEVDRVGHGHGCGSREWGAALEEVDAELRRLAERLPAHASMHVTADHGMVDVPFGQRLDLAVDTELAAGVHLVAGEPRAPRLYCQPGAAADVAATWRSRFGERALIRLKGEAIADGWFGPFAERNADRLGDVLIAFDESLAVEDSRTSKPVLLTLLGMHGSMTLDEVTVPLLSVPAALEPEAAPMSVEG